MIQRASLFEHVLAMRALIARYDFGMEIRRFRSRPLFEGTSGTTGVSYGGLRSLLRASAGHVPEAALRRVPQSKQF